MGRLALALTITVALVASAVLVLTASEDPAPAQSNAKPNVVVVMTDDQTEEQMRALSRVRRLIGRQGTTFTRNFATFPLCCPSRSTYLTGQYPQNHGVRGNSPPQGGYYKLDASNTLPVWLREAGYATAHVGKYPNGYGTRNPREVPAGWQEWYGSVDPTTYNFRNYCLNENGTLRAYGNRTRVVQHACPGAQLGPAAYQGDLYTGKAIDYINRRAPSAQPFFLSVAYLAPHSGGPNPRGGRCRGSAKSADRHRGRYANARLPRPPNFNERLVRDKPPYIRRLHRFTAADIARIRTDYQCRRESLLAVDEGVAVMVEALRARGELDNTVLVFTADNGFFQGEHRVPRGKIKPYEPSVRVPALIRGPGLPRGKRTGQLTANVDLAATIGDVAGARPRRRLDGVSLRPLARRPSRFGRRDILLQNGPNAGLSNPRYTAIRTQRYKYVQYSSGRRELYDLRFDRFEQRSVHDTRRYRSVQRRLARKLRRLRRCAGASCRR